MKLDYVYLLVANCDINGEPHSEVIAIFDKMSTAMQYCLDSKLIPESDLTDLIDSDDCFIFKPAFKWYNSPLDPWGLAPMQDVKFVITKEAMIRG